MKHNEDHPECIRLLVEQTLGTEEKLRAQRRLLACAECLEEYNRYRSLWELLTGPEYFESLEAYLRRQDSTRIHLYRQMIGRL